MLSLFICIFLYCFVCQYQSWLAVKTASEMTYIVLSGALNSTPINQPARHLTTSCSVVAEKSQFIPHPSIWAVMMSYNDWLEAERWDNDNQNCCVVYCSCALWYVHKYKRFLNLCVGLYFVVYVFVWPRFNILCFLSIKATRDHLRRMSLKWLILCWVQHKTLTESITLCTQILLRTVVGELCQKYMYVFGSIKYEMCFKCYVHFESVIFSLHHMLLQRLWRSMISLCVSVCRLGTRTADQWAGAELLNLSQAGCLEQHGSAGQQFLPGRVRSRVSMSELQCGQVWVCMAVFVTNFVIAHSIVCSKRLVYFCDNTMPTN